MTQPPKDPSDKKQNDISEASSQGGVAQGYSSTALSVDEYDIDLDTASYVADKPSEPPTLGQEATELTIDHQAADGDKVVPSVDTSTVGVWLASVRATKHMSLAEVANRLKLSPEQIAAIEANDFTQLAAPVFVQGYISSYARLLGLPQEELVAQYKLQAQPEYQVQGKSVDQSQANQTQSRFRFDRLILLGMILLLGYYAYRYLPWQQWFGNDSDRDVEVPVLQDVPTVSTDLSEADVITENEVSESSPDAPNNPLNSDSDDVEVAAEVLSVSPVELLSVGSDTTTDEVSAATSIVTNSGAQTALLPAPRTPSETNAAELLQPIISSTVSPAEFSASNTELYTADGQRIGALVPVIASETVTNTSNQRAFTLVFSADCWVEARNKAGENLVIGTISKGTTKTFDSESEVSFVLGNPDAVKISIDGVLVPKDSYIKPGSGVSRFAL